MNNNGIIDPKTGFIKPVVDAVPNEVVKNRASEAADMMANEALDKLSNKSYAPKLSAVGGMNVSNMDPNSIFTNNPTPEKAAQNKAKLPDVVSSIRNKTKTSFAKSLEVFPSFSDTGSKEGVFGTPTKIGVEQVYDIVGNKALPKYPSYTPGLNNEELAASRQTTGEKWLNGFSKLAIKTGLYGVSGVASIPAGLIGWASKGSFSGVYDNAFSKWVNEIDERINHNFAFYYKQEEKDMNFFQKMSTANFWANDLIGDGLSFTTGAMLSAFLTGGMGVASLGSAGARIGMRAAAKMSSRKLASAAVKSSFNKLKRGAVVGSAIGNSAKTLAYMGVGAGWESGTEATSALKEARDGYKQHIRDMYGREATSQEMAEFDKSIEGTINTVFAANMGIVGLSNFMLLGKYVGLNSKFANRFIPGTKGISRTKGLAKRYLFGVGAKKSKDEAGKLVATKGNLLQRIARRTWALSKAPLSEGVFEEGLQGVAQRAADDYIKSRYDKNYIRQAVGVWDAIGKGMKEQYSSKEGWNEIGMGAMIGSLFGIMPAIKGRGSEKRMSAMVDAYNKNNAFSLTSVKDVMRNTVLLGHQMRENDGVAMQGRVEAGIDSTEYEKFALSDRMGLLDSNAQDFISMVESLDESELASQYSMDEESAREYKAGIIADYKQKLESYKKATSFADALLTDTADEDQRAYVEQVAYKGLVSGMAVNEFAEDINDAISRDDSIGEGLKVYSNLKKETIEKAREINMMAGRIRKLEERIRKHATSTTRVNEEGVDTEAEAIRKETEELEKLRNEYNDAMEALGNLTVSDYNDMEFVDSARSLTAGIPTAEQVLAAYDAVSSVDYYLKGIKGRDMTETEKALNDLIIKYRNSVVDYKNFANLINKMQDEKFMSSHLKGLTAAIRRATTTEGIDLGEERTELTDSQRDVDSHIDEALKSGRMSEEEAYTAKIFNHLRDGIKAEEEGEPVEVVSDEEYDNIVNRGYVGDNEFAVLNVIASKVRESGIESLTDREKAVYNKEKGTIDYLGRLGEGDTLDSMMKDLKDSVKKYLDPENLKESNKNVVDAVRETLDEDEQNQLDEAIDQYKDVLLNGEQEDGPTEMELEDTINEIGQNSEFGMNLAPFVKQNTLLDTRGDDSSVDTETGYGTTDRQISELNNEKDEDSSKSVNVDNAQNPVVLMTRLNKEGDYEFFNLRMDRFFDYLKSIGAAISSIEMGKDLGITLSTGENVKIIASKNHARFVVTKEDLNKIMQASGLSIPGNPVDYTVVYRRDADGRVSPLYTNNGYGENGTDFIDQEAVARQQEGAPVVFVMDKNDAYNKKLWDAYQTDPSEKNKKAFVNGAVVKIMSEDGKFLSVLRSGTDKLTTAVRGMIFDSYQGDGDTVQLGTGKIVKVYPGRPVFSFSEDGSVSPHDLSDQELDRIVDVGYISNGEVYLKNGTKDYSAFPYTSKIIKGRNKLPGDGGYKNVRIPVVVIKGRTGLNYAYPVSLKKKEGADMDISALDDLIIDIQGGYQYMTEYERMETIDKINTYIVEAGLDYSEYAIPVSGSLEAIESAVFKLEPVLREANGYANVLSWEKDSRSARDIARDDIQVNMQMSDNMFVAPKIRISIDEAEDEPVSTMEDDYEEMPFGNDSKPVKVVETEMPVEPVQTEPAPVEPTPAEPTPEKPATTEPSPTKPAPKVSAEPVSREEELKPEERVAEPIAAEEKKKRTTSKKSFANKFESLDKTPAVNIFDFLCRAIGKGELVFLRNKRHPRDITAFMETRDYTERVKSISNKTGMTIDEYINWLKDQASTNDIISEYLEDRTDDEILADLKFLLKSINMKQSAAVQYVISLHPEAGVEDLKQGVSEDERKAIDRHISGLIEDTTGEPVEVESVAEEVSETVTKKPEVKKKKSEEGQLVLEFKEEVEPDKKEWTEKKLGVTPEKLDEKVKEVEKELEKKGVTKEEKKDLDKKVHKKAVNAARNSKKKPAAKRKPKAKKEIKEEKKDARRDEQATDTGVREGISTVLPEEQADKRKGAGEVEKPGESGRVDDSKKGAAPAAPAEAVKAEPEARAVAEPKVEPEAKTKSEPKTTVAPVTENRYLAKVKELIPGLSENKYEVIADELDRISKNFAKYKGDDLSDFGWAIGKNAGSMEAANKVLGLLKGIDVNNSDIQSGLKTGVALAERISGKVKQEVKEEKKPEAVKMADADTSFAGTDKKGKLEGRRNPEIFPVSMKLGFGDDSRNCHLETYYEEDGIGVGIYVDRETKKPLFVISTSDDKTYVKYYRESDDEGNLTNRWIAIVKSRYDNRKDFDKQIKIANDALPKDAVIMEDHMITVEGIDHMVRKLGRGWEIVKDDSGKPMYNEVGIAGNILAVDVDDRKLKPRDITPEEKREDAIEVLKPYMDALGITEKDIIESGGLVYVKVPEITRTKPASKKKTLFRMSKKANEEKTLIGVHNISGRNLGKAIKQGGLANPSTAVIDVERQTHEGFGEISLLMPSSLVDKKTGRNAGTYSGDAWTPVYPKTTYKLGMKGMKILGNIIKGIVGDGDMYRHIMHNISRFLLRKNNDGLAYAYLLDKGIDITPARTMEVSSIELRRLLGIEGMDIDAEETFKKASEASDEAWIKFNAWVVSEGKEDDYNKMVAWIKSMSEDVDGASRIDRYKRKSSAFLSFIEDVEEIENEGNKIDVEETIRRSLKYITDNNLVSDFKDWSYKLIEGAGAKEVFSTWVEGKGYVSVDNTLKNVSKYMKGQRRINSGFDTGAWATTAFLLDKFNSLSQIRKSKEKLVDRREFEEKLKEISGELYGLISRFIGADNMGFGYTIIQEAVLESDPIEYINSKYRFNFSKDGDFAKGLFKFIEDVKEMPAPFFETKFERPVYLNEFAAAVVPEGTDKSIISALSEAGLKISYYDPKVEGSRAEAVRRASDENIRFRTSKSLFEEYPTWLSGQTTSTGQHSTQITSTVNTYKKIGGWMEENGMEGASVLDASSGLGKGTEALRGMGFNVDDVEPYPSENREAPTYSRYEDVGKKYDVVISNAVLNVIPDDWRRDVLLSMADKVKKGGKMIINVRDAKDIEKQKQKIELDSPSEILVTDKKGNIRAYQKGFTQQELIDWVKSELGPGWKVETANKSNSGITGRAVVVTRIEDETPLEYRDLSEAAADTRFRFIGEQGAARLDAAEEATIRMDNLNVAREMETVGKDAKTIKMATGWERGADGKWRYETRDIELNMSVLGAHKVALEKQPWYDEYMDLTRKSIDNTLTGEESERYQELLSKIDAMVAEYQKQGLLSQLVNDEELFNAYPSLRETKYEVVYEDVDYDGSYNPYSNTIYISSDSIDDIQSTLVHEIQHAIQNEEGFAIGGSDSSVRNELSYLYGIGIKSYMTAERSLSKYRGMKRRLEKAKSVLDRVSSASTLEESGVSTEEVEQARNVYRGARRFIKQILESNDIDSSNIPDLSVALSISDASGEALPMIESQDSYNEMIEGLSRVIDKFESKVKKYKSYSPSSDKVKRIVNALSSKKNFELYESLMGEVEARNAERRMSMTTEERRESLAAETEDVAREDQIFMEESLGVMDSAVQEVQDAETAVKLAETLNTEIEVINDISEIEESDPELLSQKQRAKGWYDVETGKIYLVMPNIDNAADAQATILHEVVVHKGLRGLFGDKFESEMRRIYNNLSDEARSVIDAAAESDYDGDKLIATEEYLAEVAESGVEAPGLWSMIVSAIKNFFRNMGLNIPISSDDVSYMLWKSKQNLMNSESRQKAVFPGVDTVIGENQHIMAVDGLMDSGLNKEEAEEVLRDTIDEFNNIKEKVAIKDITERYYDTEGQGAVPGAAEEKPGEEVSGEEITGTESVGTGTSGVDADIRGIGRAVGTDRNVISRSLSDRKNMINIVRKSNMTSARRETEKPCPVIKKGKMK